MFRYRLSPMAEQDVEALLAWMHEQFGEPVRLRYEALLVRAILDLAEDVGRAGSRERTELGKGVFAYHLRHSRDQVSRSVGPISNPQHLLLYRPSNDGCLEIGRVLHDSMELFLHRSPDDQGPSEELPA